MAGGGWSPEKLTAHLRSLDVDEIYMTFAELDAVAGVFPESAHSYPAYWTNGRESRPHSKAWLDAGFLATPQFVERRVWFHRGVPRAPGPRTRGPSPVSTSPSLPPDLYPGAEIYQAEIVYAWHDVGRVLLTRGRLDIPNMGAGPGVYCFTLSEPDGTTRSYYVGESENLWRRMLGYQNPGSSQATNVRLNRILSALLEAGGGVRLAVVFEATLGGTPLDIGRKPDRLIVENTALVDLAAQGFAVENLRTGS